MSYILLPFVFVLLVSLIIGIKCAKGSSTEKNSYFLANRSLGWGLLTMTFVATQVGGGFILGTSDAAYEMGFWAICFPIGYVLGFLMLGMGFGGKLRSLELSTASEVFERYYNSRLLKQIAALLSIVSLTGILIGQAVALRSFLVSLGAQEWWVFLFAWAIVVIYTTQGGFLAVVWTDSIQAFVMIGMLVGTFLLIYFGVPHTNYILHPNNGSWEIAQPKLLGYILIPSLFTLMEQDMVQRCFAGKSKRDVAIASALSALILLLLAAIPVFMGCFGRLAYVPTGQNSKFMEVIKLFNTPFLTACAASAILLAIVSTASSLLSAVSSNVAQDFMKKGTNELPMNRIKWITLLIGVIAFIGSYGADNILSCMIASYELSVASLLLPFILAVFIKERSAKYLPAAILSAAFGCLGFCCTKAFVTSAYADLIPLVSALLGFAIGLIFLALRKPAKEPVIPSSC